MKKLLSTIIILIYISTIANGQQGHPQYHFYRPTEVLTNRQFSNAIEEYDFFANELKNQDYNINQKLSILYHMYIIEKENMIFYSTIDNNVIPIQPENNNKTGSMIDFGAPLISNADNTPNYSINSSYALKFGSPIKRIDPIIFNYKVDGIRLPASTNLTYQSSPEIRIDNLASIEGKDVVNNQSLISKDGTLIVAATASLNSYQIPDQVKKIGAGALRGSKAKSIIVPEFVTHIGDRAFDLSSTSNFYFLSTTPPMLGESVFGDYLKDDFSIFVPKKQVRTFKKAYPHLSHHIKSIEKDNGEYYYIQAENASESEDNEKAITFLKLAAKRNHPEANYMLGVLYLISSFDASLFFEQLDIEPTEYESLQSEIHSYGIHGNENPLKYLKKAARQNHLEAMELLTVYYLYVPADTKSAAKWIKRAMRIDYTTAFYLGGLLTNYKEIGVYDLVSAKKVYQDAFQICNDNKEYSWAEVADELIHRFDYLNSKKADKRIRLKCSEENFTGDLLEWDLYYYFNEREFYLVELAQKIMDSAFLISEIEEDEAFDLAMKVVKNWERQGFASIK